MAFADIDNRSSKTTDVWLTPPELVKSLGSFDLDPCSPIDAPWRLAPLYYTEKHDGLKMPWCGRVFMNPPYGIQAKHWLKKLADHGNGVALIFARIETKMFRDFVWKRADAVLFFDKRLNFYNEKGEKASNDAGAPSCLVAWGGA